MERNPAIFEKEEWPVVRSGLNVLLSECGTDGPVVCYPQVAGSIKAISCQQKDLLIGRALENQELQDFKPAESSLSTLQILKCFDDFEGGNDSGERFTDLLDPALVQISEELTGHLEVIDLLRIESCNPGAT